MEAMRVRGREGGGHRSDRAINEDVFLMTLGPLWWIMSEIVA